MRILVTGTSGGIGGAVKRAALSAGHEVVELNRGGFADLSAALPPVPAVFDAVVFATGCCPVKPLTRMTDG